MSSFLFFLSLRRTEVAAPIFTLGDEGRFGKTRDVHAMSVFEPEAGEQVPPASASRHEASLVAAQQRARTHKTSHPYTLEEFGLEADEIHARLADLFERFGWEDAR